MEKCHARRVSATLGPLAFRNERDYTSTDMTRDRSIIRLPSTVGRAATCLLVAAQLLLAFAPLMEWQFGADARSHVEAAGTSAHHAHNPADCAACTARGLLAVVTGPIQPAIRSLRAVAAGLSERDEHLALLRESESRPRAPPIRQA